MPDDPKPNDDPKSDDPPAKDDPPGNTDPKPDPDRDALGEPGKKALDAERKARRDAEQRAKDLEAKVKEFEDRDKTEQQKLAEELEAAKATGSQANDQLLRLEVALDKAPEGMPVSEVRKFAKRLTGASREDLEADAEELFELFATDDGGSGGTAPRGKPTPRLRGGGKPNEEPEETDPLKLAARLPRHY